MSLPPAFRTAEEYFEAACEFFLRYRFLCASPNTDVLVNNVLDEIDLSGVEHADVFAAGLGALATRNTFLCDFYNFAMEIKPRYEEEHACSEEAECVGSRRAPLGPKKRHEVARLARALRVACARAGCQTVVDFGCGLGYLDQQIFETSSYNVIGLECNEQHYLAATSRQRRYHAHSVPRVQYVHCTVGAGSQRTVQRLVEARLGRQPYCLAGLHCCADLSVDALNIFLENEDAKALVIMPCCYHKMREVGGRFENFPLSGALRAACERGRGRAGALGLPFLRLAAQPPPPAPAPAAPHLLLFNLLARAALQLYAHANNCKIKRNKRKAVKTKEMECNFEKYIQSAVHGFSMVSCESAADFRPLDLRELRRIWQQVTNSTTLKQAAIFILLQQTVQELAENLILFDRLMYLRERGIENCAYRKVFDEKISPRALALVAYK